MRLLLDTCVLSELRNPACSPAVKAFIAPLPASTLFVSVISLGEIAKGVALLPDGERKRGLDAWRVGLSGRYEDRVVPLDQETAEIWGELTAASQKKGFIIPAADGLLAATALRHGLHVATRNQPHFEQAGAMVVNPWLTPSAAVQ